MAIFQHLLHASIMDDQMDPELQQAVMMEAQRAKFTNNVHSLTNVCWDKCVSKIATQTDNKVQKCLTNCVDRFVDTTFFVANKMSSAGGGR